MSDDAEVLHLDGHEVRITNPAKIFFPALGLTKMDLVRYWLAVAEGALRSVKDRPTLLKRYPNGVDGDFFHQKRAPTSRPDWIRTVTVRFPSMRTADFLAPADRAHIAWAVNLGCLELHPWAVRASDVEHPDEFRIDLDPTDEMTFDDVRTTARCARSVLGDHGLTGFIRTSGKRGMHILSRIRPEHEYTEVRRAALALAREIERRLPDVATTAWWKEERHGVFVDYNMNARDRTLASSYSVRPTPDGRVACPISWDELDTVDPAALTITTVPARVAKQGDPHEGMDDAVGSLQQALDLAARDEKEGAGDAPWPPNFPKQPGEPKRVQPSKARTDADARPKKARKDRRGR